MKQYEVIEVWNTEEVSHGLYDTEEHALDYIHASPPTLRGVNGPATCLFIREVE